MSTNRPTASQPSSSRQALQRRSALPLAYLRHLPAWLPPTVLAALLVAGLAVKGWPGAVALCVVAAFLGWLALGRASVRRQEATPESSATSAPASA